MFKTVNSSLRLCNIALIVSFNYVKSKLWELLIVYFEVTISNIYRQNTVHGFYTGPKF